MSTAAVTHSDLIRQAVIEVAQLPDDDLLLLVDFLNYLKMQRDTAGERRATAAQIRDTAIRRAEALRGLPREQRVAQLTASIHRLHADALAKGVAIAEEWRGD